MMLKRMKYPPGALFYDPTKRTISLREEVTLPVCGEKGQLALSGKFVCEKCSRIWEDGCGNTCWDAWVTWNILNA
jgi:hypothetical protein